MRLSFAHAIAGLLLSFACTAQAATEPTTRPAPTPIKASKIILVGDSTTAVQGGWGPSFCARHVTSFVACLNLARGGRSSYSYRAEGSWDIALAEMATPGYQHTWVLLQFGHNDQPGKPGRSTDLQTEFPANLRRYVQQVRDAGATPVLVTPLTRRQFEDGQLKDDLAPWVEVVREVAAQMQVPLLDLNARSRQLIQGMGPVLSMATAQRPPAPAQVVAAQAGTSIDMAKGNVASEVDDRAGSSRQPMAQPKLSFDYTHLGPEGADLFAAIIADELAQQVPALRPLLYP
ncbi:rhamnogalacturonan acetylesterase [Pseudoxanthomonas dokdonensis]|uniref:Lysophospholipase n=1 Tax=Pseudoxanthomonas dokdonensis TaxID=344882 RepID=A0A0R0CTA4_9GAMM|nr:rhamnogalacturonan acetylesterase [Pseudoxanthomonas dokdonensis]KRG69546.1 lysophospholipase [Pseudoxanthomonas dokdonensis]